MRVWIAAAVLLAASDASAQKVFKCVDKNGTTVFSKEECGSDAKAINLGAASRNAAPVGSSSALTEISNAAALAGLDSECRSRLDSIDRDLSGQIGDQQRQVAILRRDMDYSFNNLAGATRDAGLQTQIAGIESRIAALETARTTQLANAQAQCEAKHDAELAHQDAERQRAAERAAAEAEALKKAAAEKASQQVDGS